MGTNIKVKLFVFVIIFAVFISCSVSAKPKRFAVILSGCGVFDGSEIHESVLTLLAIKEAKCDYACFAPDIKQAKVVNHLNKQMETDEIRNTLVESARIARGHIKPLSELKVEEFDAIVMPGGLGVITTLSDFQKNPDKTYILPTLKNILRTAYNKKKLLGFICISPVIAAKLFGSDNVRLTLGTDYNFTKKLKNTGATFALCGDTGFVKDSLHKIYSTPGYMCNGSIERVAKGIKKMIFKMAGDI